MCVSAAGGLPRYFDHERSADKRLVKIAHFPEPFGSFTPVCVVLHGLRHSRIVDRRLGGQTIAFNRLCIKGLCNLDQFCTQHIVDDRLLGPPEA
jgi:hypothetical protein